MKKIIFAIAISTLTGGFCFAQNAKPTSASAPVGRDAMNEVARTNAQKETERLDKQLHFTDKQKAAMNGINMKYAILGAQGDATTTPQIQKMKEEAVKRELTADQFEKYKAMTK